MEIQPKLPGSASPRKLDVKGVPESAQLLPAIEDSAELMHLTAHKLNRPVLLVHGLGQDAGGTWVNFKNFFLTNPENRYGANYSKANENEFLLEMRDKWDANVFAIDLSDNLASPQQVASEVTRAAHWIHEITGQSVDVITHSMGALTARQSLHESEQDDMHSVIMVAPPNGGAYEANLATRLDKMHLYHHYPKDHWGAMEALKVEYGPFGGVQNEWLHDLNLSWDQDKTRLAQTAIIAGTGVPTPDRRVLATGDGMVAARRAGLGEDTPMWVAVPSETKAGEENYRDFQSMFYNHLSIVSSPEVYAQVDKLLASAPPDPPAPVSPMPQQRTLAEETPDPLWQQPGVARWVEPAPGEQAELFAK